ncbi:hypothetical protein F7U74_22385, partial [Vibrio vulnificus]|nr:hypothetical protein [Vibrio vulnificus]
KTIKINWLWLFLSSFSNSFRFFGKSALFMNVSFELLPQLSFEIARGQSVWRKVALEALLSL